MNNNRARGNAMALYEDLKVFSGNAHRSLAKSICDYLGIALGACEVFKFSNDNTFVRILENVRQQDIFLVQPIAYPVNDSIMELLIMIDAVKRASAGRVTAVIPYYAYARSDKKDQPRVPITARLLANLIETAGADRVLTLELHAGQIQGFFNIPLDELTAIPLLSQHFHEKNVENNIVVVATDAGDAKRARNMAYRLDAPLAIVEKVRIGNQERVEAATLIGDVRDKTAVIVDDEIGTGGTVIATAETIHAHGARDIYCYAAHAVLAGEAATKLETSRLKELIVTDSLPLPPYKCRSKTRVVSVAPLLGEAIYRIHSGKSVGAMFNEDRA